MPLNELLRKGTRFRWSDKCDYLSKLDGHASGDGEFEPTIGCELLMSETALEELDFSTFMVEQGKDPECSEIIRFLRNDELPSDKLGESGVG